MELTSVLGIDLGDVVHASLELGLSCLELGEGVCEMLELLWETNRREVSLEGRRGSEIVSSQTLSRRFLPMKLRGT